MQKSIGFMKKFILLLLLLLIGLSSLQALTIQENFKSSELSYSIDLPDGFETLSKDNTSEGSFELNLYNRELNQQLSIVYAKPQKERVLNYQSTSSYLYSLITHPKYKNSFEVMKKIYHESKKTHPYLVFKLHEVQNENDLIFEKKGQALGPFEEEDHLIRVIKISDYYCLISLSQKAHFSKEEKNQALQILKDSKLSIS